MIVAEVNELNRNAVGENELVLLEQLHIDEFQLNVARERAGRRMMERVQNIGEPEIEEVRDDGANREPHGWRCLRCRIGIVEMICKPCNCVCLCQVCVNAIRASGQQLQCPMCRGRVTTFEILYITETDHEGKINKLFRLLKPRVQ